MWRGIRRYGALGRADRRLLMRAFLGLTLADLSLRSAGFSRLMQRLRVAPRESGSDSMAAKQPERYAHWIEVASRHHLVRARCLHRSLVLHQWLLRDGLASQLRIGVRKEGRTLHAHAWVELDGQAIHEHADALAAFTPLAAPRGQHATRMPPGNSAVATVSGIEIRRPHKRAKWA